MKKLPKINTSKLLKAALPYILVGLMATKLGQAYRMASGGDVLDRIFGAFLKIGEAFASPCPACIRLTCWWGLLRRSAVVYRVSEIQECPEIPAWCGVWDCPMGKCKRY
mgnify:CR=1 FL=1